MGVLRKAYVKVAPDTSTFDRELKDRLSKIKADGEGEKVGKTFTTGLTRTLDRQLKQLHLPTLDLKANPREALAAIEKTERDLKALRDSADSIELRIKTEKTLGNLSRFKKQLGDVGDDMGVEVGAKLGLSTVRGLFGELTASFKNPPPQLAAGAAILGVALAPVLGAAVAAGVVGGAAGVGIIGGIKLAARDPQVQAEGKLLSAFLLGDLEQRARQGGFVTATLDGIGKIRSEWVSIGPDLDRVFKSSRFIDPLADGIIAGARQVVAGAADAIENADPVVNQFSRSIGRIGGVVGDSFSLLAGDAQEGASALDDLTDATVHFIETAAGAVHVLAEVKGGFDGLDKQIDRFRYYLEDSASKSNALAEGLDLTADGFKKGSVEAEAYRRVTLGTATAADQALVAQAQLEGKTGELSAEQRAGAESALAQAQAQQQQAAATERAKVNADALKVANQGLQQAQDVLNRSIDNLAPAAGNATRLVDALRRASEQMYGATINQTEANEGYEASWDSLSAAVGSNGRSLDIHTEKGRTNRDALQELLVKNNDLYFANIAAGSSVDSARKKHEARTEAVRKEAVRLGLNREETQKLITTYGKIPPDKTTKLLLDGLKAISDQLTNVYIAQRALAEGKTVSQIRGGYQGNARLFKAEGGPITGPGTATSDSVHVMASKGEFMQRAAAVDYYGADAMHALNERRIPRDRVRGFASGGLIADVDTSRRIPFNVDVSQSYVMSKSEALKRVTPAAPSGGQSLDFMVKVLRSAFPGLHLISGYRPGATTLSGNQSYHALKRAVDYPPNIAMARWVNENYKARTKEFISPYQQYNIHNGQRHSYTGAVWNQHNFAGGNAHNHWAMDNGGYLAPGWNPPIYNGTGRREPVTPAADIEALGRKLDAILTVLRGAPAETGSVIARQMGSAISGSIRDTSRLAKGR